ncbi:MAG: ribosomal protection-like ABC-F family protein [Candidatus Portnoybacteria bacterium]
MITLQNISKSFGTNLVLKDISFALKYRERLGVVGSNGVGKTTLLKIMEGCVKSSSGTIEKSKDIRICYIPQEITPSSNTETGRDYLVKISEHGFVSILDSKECRSIFGKLSMKMSDLNQPLCALSGGLRAKIALLPFFLSQFDIFLLDEPTNNLDLRGLLFLEQKVIQSSSMFLIVSHDRRFLDRIVNKIIEIDEHYHTATIYKGGFSDYLEERKKRISRQWQKYKDYQGEIKRLQESVKKQKQRVQRGKSSSKRTRDQDKLSRGYAKERSGKVGKSKKQLGKRIERIEKITKPWTRLPMKFNLEVNERSGDVVFDLKKVVKRKQDFSIGPIDLTINYGAKMAILGANGKGKTTLLRILLGEEIPDGGIFRIGSRVNIGYLSQELNLDPSKTLLEEFLYQSPLDETTGRKLLNRFGLEKIDVDKKIKELSPGERSRLILSILMSKHPNCLILDEPSNHLDLEALIQLERALSKYPGTLIIVSHDRYLLDQIPLTKTFVLEESGLLNAVTSHSVYEKHILNDL